MFPTIKRSIYTIGLLAILAGNAAAETCQGSDVRKALLEEYDKLVFLTPADVSKAKATHAPWGTPPCPKLLIHREYLVCFDLERRVASWVSYKLTSEDVTDRGRLDAFRSDPRLTEAENAHCADYKYSGYDRGHAVPRSDMNRSQAVQANTFLLSNMAPQTPALNRGMWRWLEESTRSWAIKFGEIYITAGSVFIGQELRVASDRVAIPREFYKIVVRKDDNGELRALSFLLINGTYLPVPPGSRGIGKVTATSAAADHYLVQHLKSVGTVERLTKINFFPSLPQSMKTEFEETIPTELWPKN
jgi:endonuclease G